LHGTMMNKLIRETLKTWMHAWKALHDPKFDPEELPSADAACDIKASEGEPYVTIFNKSYDGLSITVHDNSLPKAAVLLVEAFDDAMALVEEKMPALFQAPAQPAPKTAEPKEPIQFPTQDSEESAIVAFRASKLVGNDYMIESGKRDSVAWKEVTKATKPFDRSKVEHADGELVAYFVNAPIVVKAPNGKTCMEVPTSGGKFTFWQAKRDSDEPTFDWQSIETQMYGVNVLAEQLTDGFKLNMPCLLIVKFTHSGGKEYANFYGFRALPQKQAQTA
jgi:hypothetical protein